MEAVKALASACKENNLLLLNLLCNECDELNTADLHHTYNHRSARVKFLTIRGPVEATLFLCSKKLSCLFFSDHLLASYFFKSSLSERRIVYKIRPHGEQPIRHWVAQLHRPEEMRAGEICAFLNSVQVLI